MCSLECFLIWYRTNFLMMRLRSWFLRRLWHLESLLQAHGQCLVARSSTRNASTNQEWHLATPFSVKPLVFFSFPYTDSCKQVLKSRPQSKNKDKNLGDTETANTIWYCFVCLFLFYSFCIIEDWNCVNARQALQDTSTLQTWLQILL